MSNVTLKDTKQVIFEALQAKEKELAELKAGKFDPTAEKKAKETTEKLEKAEAIVDLGILSEEILDQWNALTEAIELKKAELEEYYSIEKNVNTLAALVDSKKLIEAQMDTAFAARQAEWDASIAALKVEYAELKRDLIAEHEKYKKELEVERAREQEEHEYKIARERKIENDKWEDEKTEREEALAAKESEYEVTVKDLESRETRLEELESRVEEIPTLIATATEEGFQKGNAEAVKIANIKEAAMKKELEFDKKLLQNEVETLKTQLAKAEAEKEAALAKLEAAQDRVQTIATDAVKSTQPRSNNDK